MVCFKMVLSNVFVDITISRRMSVFNQADVQIPAGLTNVSGLAVTAFDLKRLSVAVVKY